MNNSFNIITFGFINSILIKMKSICFMMLLVCFKGTTLMAQDTKVNVTVYDGIIVAGYVDHGGFSNFMGPNVNLTYKQSKFLLGALPSLRYKTDHATPKNSFVTPNLGLGFTYTYKSFALQIPFYYNAKTATANGVWNAGIGLGFRLNNGSVKK